MPTNLANFNKALDESSKRIHGDFEKFHKMVCLETLKRIIFRTPVDTGRARGNWQTEIGNTPSGVLDVEGSRGEMASFAMKNGITELASIPAYSIVHITNNLEYIYYLEYDKRSQQFPEGMVEITLTEMANWLWDIKRPSLSFLKE